MLTTYTVRFNARRARYDVLAPDGSFVDGYPFDPERFDTRREAWQLALEDAETRAAADARRAYRAQLAAQGAVADAVKWQSEAA